MYSIASCSYEEYVEAGKRGIEPAFDAYEDIEEFTIERLDKDGVPLAYVAHRDIYDYRYVCAIIMPEAKANVLSLVEIGREYLDSLQSSPLLSIADKESIVFNRFLVAMGYRKSDNLLAKVDESGKMYNVYIRV